MTKPTKQHKARNQNYTAIIRTYPEDKIDLVHISAKSSDKAYEELTETYPYFNNITILNKSQLKDLLKQLKELK